ncbi:YdcF family protein [Streptomyces sp. NPDC057702]|uniref:YdcF family protein n=1 Tax=unclassified Streptomyces TaxID=2593676 RepID=UPI00369D5D60
MSTAHEELGDARIREVTGFVDIAAPPAAGEAVALLVFGTHLSRPAELAAEWYHRGTAPLVIVTGGVNRHNGVVEGREFRRLLRERDVPESAIRCEDASANTWQNVEFARPYLREALGSGLRIAVVGKWYHRRTLHCLTTLVPDIGPFHALTWDPVYDGQPLTRDTWARVPGGRRRVVREWEESVRRVADGTFRDARRGGDGAWRG